ncbi:HAD-IC family P-type ATPase [Pseudonocardia benzenivorans]
MDRSGRGGRGRRGFGRDGRRRERRRAGPGSTGHHRRRAPRRRVRRRRAHPPHRRGPVLLTGDAARPAAAVAARLGLVDVRSGLLPDDKADVVEAWRRDGRTVLAAGDGVNDAPLLAVADVGLAVGAGASALSVQAGDGVLLRDPMAVLPALVELARRATRVARANLVVAGAVIAGLVTWDLVGTLPLVLGVAGHELSTVVVCLNGLRLLVGGARVARERPLPAADRAEGSSEVVRG